jgi:predicted nucleic acid-binding protein
MPDNEEGHSNNTILVDTDVFSYWIKGDSRGDPYHPYSIGRKLALSFASVAELYYWEQTRKWGFKLINQLEQKVSQCAILPANDDVCREFAAIRYQLRNKPIGYIDYWVGACAKSFKCPILTNNYNHFSRIDGIKLLGPYSN